MVLNRLRVNIDLGAVVTSLPLSSLLTAWEKKTPATITLGTVHHRTTAHPLVTPARSGRMFSLLPAMHRAPCHTTTPTSTPKVVQPHQQAS